ncbi:MAG: hypothetical protein WDO15_11250 [Bacteroidota bacterium]
MNSLKEKWNTAGLIYATCDSDFLEIGPTDRKEIVLNFIPPADILEVYLHFFNPHAAVPLATIN